MNQFIFLIIIIIIFVMIRGYENNASGLIYKALRSDIKAKVH